MIAVTFIVMIIVLAVKSRSMPEGQAIGWDPISLSRHSMFPWLVVIGSFLIGFIWEYRRATH